MAMDGEGGIHMDWFCWNLADLVVFEMKFKGWFVYFYGIIIIEEEKG